jgi:ABC-type uncharacterized transport system permease subunit
MVGLMAKQVKVLNKSQRRRAQVLGVVMLLLSVGVVWLFIPNASGESTFVLSTPDEAIQVDPLVVPASGSLWLLAAVLAFLGGTQFFKGFQSKSTLFLGVALLIFVAAMLVWATAGKDFSLVGMLSSTIARCVPIALGAIAGILCERSGVINIAIEGMLLGGAFVGVLIGSVISGWAGLAAATLSGAVLSLLLAFFAIRYRVDQIIVGIVINIFVLGLTSFLTAQVLVNNPSLNNVPIMKSWKLPILGDIPVIGPVFFNQTWFVYATFILVAVVAFALFRTRWGLRTRSVGENPKAADTVGIKVQRTRYIAVTLGGMVGGFAGAWFTIGTVGRFDENMTGGRGFIALAAMIFARWNPIGALAAATVFGFSDSLQQKLAVLQVPIPSEFLAMAPYLVTIVVVAGLVGRARAPAADGQPYP